MSEWISIEDRLPDDNQWILIWRYPPPYAQEWVERGDISAVKLICNNPRVKGPGFTHWMPLPAPPETQRPAP